MSAVGSIVGGLISGGASLIGGSMANSAAKENTQDSIRFMEEMSNTAHQREVRDLKAAGLNPILSAGGNGASVPSAPVAPVVNALGDAMKAGITNYSALQSSRQVDPVISNVESQTNLNDVLAAKAAADTTSALANARKTEADTASMEKSPLLSRITGTDFLSKATDAISDKVHDIISGVHVNSAKKVPVPKSEWPPARDVGPFHNDMFLGPAEGAFPNY